MLSKVKAVDLAHGSMESLQTDRTSSFSHALRTRLSGPGGLYNIGNILGLGSGVTLAFLRAPQDGSANWSATLTSYLVGDIGSTALTVAMILFFWSGEVYHRAALAGPTSQRILLRRADFVSGLAAFVLAISLIYAGSLLLALTSTALLAGGKFASAIWADRPLTLRLDVAATVPAASIFSVDLFRSAVILSRIPAIASLAIALWAAMANAAPALDVVQFAILLVCYGLWTSADVALNRLDAAAR